MYLYSLASYYCTLTRNTTNKKMSSLHSKITSFVNLAVIDACSEILRIYFREPIGNNISLNTLGVNEEVSHPLYAEVKSNRSRSRNNSSPNSLPTNDFNHLVGFHFIHFLTG